jgi:glucose-1-phosphate adenylyltransferase
VVAGTQAFILAGGEGERLHPLTLTRPKPAVSFGGIFRIIDFTLANCAHSGLNNVSLLTQYRQEELHRYVRQSWGKCWNKGGVPRFLPPTSGKRYRGTADAVFHNLDLIEAEPAEFVLILSGDHIYEMDYRALLKQHAETGADLTIASVEYSLRDASRFGVIEIDQTFKVTGFEEKPVHPHPMPARPAMALVNMGVYVFKKSVLINALRQHCEADGGHDFARHIIPSLIASKRTFAYDFRDSEGNPGYWRDIGTIDSYYRAHMDILYDVRTRTLDDGPITPRTTRESLVMSRLNRHSCVRRTVVSAGVSLDRGVVLDESVLMPNVNVGKGAVLRRTIVEEGTHIPPGFRAGFELEHDRRHHTVTGEGVVVISAVAT